MELYGKQSSSLWQKTTITIAELLLLVLSFAILFMPFGESVFEYVWGSKPQALPLRKAIVFGFSIIVFIRMKATLFIFLKRQIPLEEVISVPVAFSLYYIGFSFFVINSPEVLGLPDYFAMALFVWGSYLNSFSEYRRHVWKKRPENKGKIYTEGLFKYSMHINYFGDMLWVIAYTIICHNIWAYTIPAFLFAFFAFANIPKLDAYLAEKYGDSFKEYAAKTKKFIPYIY